MNLYYDSKATIHTSDNPKFHQSIKDIEKDSRFTTEKIMAGIINAVHIGQPNDESNSW